LKARRELGESRKRLWWATAQSIVGERNMGVD
jgi:hypothetical protein